MGAKIALIAAVVLLGCAAAGSAIWYGITLSQPEDTTTQRGGEDDSSGRDRQRRTEDTQSADVEDDSALEHGDLDDAATPNDEDVLPDETEIASDPDTADYVAVAPSGDWGDLVGTFVYDGDAPMPEAIAVSSDRAVCGRHALVSEDLVVDPKTKGVKNVVVFMYLKRGDDPPKVHPDYNETAEDKVVLDNINCRFEPRVTLLRTSQTLQVKNSDPIGHNTRVSVLSGTPISPLVPPSGEMEVTFDTVERLPCQVACNIHPWMTGWIVIRDNPYMAVTDEQGKFKIANVPLGEWTFQFWHERIGYIREVTVDGKNTEWSRGRVEFDIQPGPNSVGKVAIRADDD